MFCKNPKDIVFFGHIANYDNAAAFNEAVARVNQERYQVDLTENIFTLSQNTRLKHRLVDFAVVWSGAALAFTVLVLLVTSLI